ncbi:hypothetical protein ARALYDRAFT_890668 [Arabidopsis lyrata subsp. lyrata]|uniref:F-box associated beta-propeller type 3 domain-containing protein n=1 Tax=Arabidopsis lyrata subsp. lyrata TaxID=81972 RepID=D7KFS7_ARALL|nr:hypothetical protein ARALYDRAFT_890668 [Arabidopsis lyrata subsp. lyrata]
MRIPKEDEDEQRVLYDPLTGQYVILPQLRGESDSYLGFDPIDKEFKVLVMNTSYYTAYNDVDHHILTVGTGKLRWRKIQCPFTHEPFWERICINGILYYLALDSDGRYFMVVCFDVRSEKFKLVDIECRFDQLVNYKGKLCGIDLKNAYYGGFPLELRMWVLEDVQKREWSKYVYTLRDDNKVVKVNYNLSVSGMTATGDIVLLLNNASNPYYVSYFNPERNTLQIQSVEIQGLRANCDRMAYYYAFVDYVEDLSVNDAMQLKSSPLQQCQNIVTEKPRQRCYTSRDLSNSAPSVMNDVEDLSVNDAVLQLKSNPLQQCQNIVTKRPKPRHRRHTSRDLSKSSPFVKNKQQNNYASGLIYFHNMRIPREDEDEKRVLCDPLTGQYVILPELRVGHSCSYLGFDPIDKEFKVLFMNTSDYIASNDVDHYILTLGTGKLKWRKIRCPFTHEPVWNRICINGVLYYLAISSNGLPYVLVCFDVRSEKFKLLDIEYRYGFDGLINYKGKLCGINLKYAYHGGFPVKLTMRVLEDVEKPEWSKHDYSLWVESKVVKVNNNLSVSGMTATGDIVLSMKYVSNPCYIFYFNPERNTLQVQSVEIQGLGANRDCISYYAFVDYVEDLSVNDAMLQLKSSPLLQGRNIVTKRPKPKHRRHTSRDLSKSAPSVKNKHQNKKYHFIIPIDTAWNMPLDDDIFDLQTHLLHKRLIHSNGFGHFDLH